MTSGSTLAQLKSAFQSFERPPDPEPIRCDRTSTAFRPRAHHHVRPLSSSRLALRHGETLCFPISFVSRMTGLEPFFGLAFLLIASLSFVSQRSSAS